jgi:hypothetical protein
MPRWLLATSNDDQNIPAAIAAGYAVNWAVTDWYLDQVTGNDSNDGVTAATPLKTGAELFRRLGPWAIWDHSVTIHLLASGILDGLVVGGEFTDGGNLLTIIGTPTVVSSFALTTYDAVDHTIPRGPQVTSGTVVTWTPGTRLIQTSGTNVGTSAFVVANLSGSIGLTSPWAKEEPTLWYPTLTPPETNETFDVQTLPPMSVIDINIIGPYQDPATYLRLVDLAKIRVLTSAYISVAGFTTGSCWVKGCIFIGSLDIPNSTSSQTGNLSQCFLRISDLKDLRCIHCGFGPNPLPTAFANRMNCLGNTFIGVSTVYGVATWLGNAGVALSLQDVTLWQAPASRYLLRCNPGSSLEMQAGVSGRTTQATTYGLSVLNGARFDSDGTTLNLAGTSGEVRLNSAPATTITCAQLAAAKGDWARTGGDALVAGTKIVTVPYYNSANIVPLACVRALSVTPGFLSVQIISDTQFTVTSSVGTDTSTFSWFIPPSGRNIFFAI